MAEPANDLSPVARQHLKRNYRCGVLNGVAYRVAETMIDPTLVLTWFLTQLTSSSFIIGLVAPLRSAGWFLPQLLVSSFAQRQERKITLYRVCGLVRAVAIASLAAATWLVGARPVPMLIIFFLCLALLSFGEGFSGISFMDIVAKAIPPRRRGSFFALRSFLGGTLALGSGAAVRYVLSAEAGLAFPANFAILFSLAAVGIWISVIGFSSIVEPIEPVDPKVVTFAAQLRRAWWFLKQDHNFRRLILVRLLLVAGGGLATPFYIVYAKNVLNATAGSVGTYLLAFTIASIASNVLWGRISSRQGNKRVIVASILIGLCIPLTALLAGRMGSLQLFLVPFVLRGVYESSNMIGPVNFVLDIAPAAERPIYIGLINTVLGFASLALMMSGVIVQVTGFEVLFLLTTAFFVLAFVAALGLRDPSFESGEPQRAVGRARK